MESIPYKYIFSVIMSVYNVDPYIKEAVNSILNQTIGLEKIQIIFVDDGSTDRSGILCDEYEKLYGDNILVIHKKNEGLSSARMEGLQYVQGKYVSFFDPDDVLDCNAFADIFRFFEENDVDVVSIPLVLFGERNGGHPLNYKYDRGTRVIYLNEEPNAVLLSCASAFYTREAVGLMDFDRELVTAEDAKENVKILLEKQKMGVVSSARYWYRIRSDSTVRSAQRKKGWYIDYLDHYSYWAIKYSREKLGKVPQFVQYMVFYDLQWKYLNNEIPRGVLDAGEEDLYREKLFGIVDHIDDEVIVSQKNIYTEHKLFLLYKKYGCEPDHYIGVDKTVYYGYKNMILGKYNAAVSHMDFLRMEKDQVFIQADQITFERKSGDKPAFFLLLHDHTMIETKLLPYVREIKSVGTVIARVYYFEGSIPINSFQQKTDIRIMTRYKNYDIIQECVLYGKYFPITDRIEGSYYYKDGIVFQRNQGGISAEKADQKKLAENERKYSAGLLKEHSARAIKALLSRKAYFCFRRFMPKKIWLIMDKANRAGDNGEAFFRYLVGCKESDCCPIFVVGKHSDDYKRLGKIGHVVPYMSLQHKILFLFAEFVISAYSHEEVSSPYLVHHYYYSNIVQDSRIVFLQHGIIKDDVSVGLNRMSKNYALFVTSTEREQRSVIDGNYGYSKEQVILTGLPRYDLLYNDTQNFITIMPTWRRNLCGSYDPHTSQWSLLPGFEKSDFFLFYNELINSGLLLDAAESMGYKIQFLVHPVFQPYISRFSPDSRVIMRGSSAAYNEIFAESAMIVTDYSSVAFDFAYLHKPVAYVHFDKNHYQEGYFDYERDGFGEIAKNMSETVDLLVGYMKNGCQLKEKYRRRIDAFFTFRDANNCERVYNKMIKLRTCQ